MISAIIACAVLSAAWLTFECYRAPTGREGPSGFEIVEPGRRLEEFTRLKADSMALLGFWCLG